jgi:hypothetical protein
MWHGQARESYHCPACLWSKHVSIGEEAGYPPRGGMMRARAVDLDDADVRLVGKVGRELDLNPCFLVADADPAQR